MSEPLISIEDLRIKYKDESALLKTVPESIKQYLQLGSDPVLAVDDVSLDIEENEVVSVIGESGSGKTSLGKSIVALQPPTAGRITYRGQDIYELQDRGRIKDTYWNDVRRELQIIHQDATSSLNPYRKLIGILKDPLRRWYPENDEADYRAHVHEMLDTCGLTPPEEYTDRYPHELSGGERQRVSLVRATLAKPDLVFADEPVRALDRSLRIKLMDLMLELKEKLETSFLFVSHSIENARYMAAKADGRLAVMYRGEIVEIGPVTDVIENPQHPYTKVLKWGSLPYDPERAREAVREESPLRQDGDRSSTAAEVPTGCKFYPRCPKAKTTCVDRAPELVATNGNSHRVACHRQVTDDEYWDSEFVDEAGEIKIPGQEG